MAALAASVFERALMIRRLAALAALTLAASRAPRLARRYQLPVMNNGVRASSSPETSAPE
jgi:hypothetical protein